MRPFVKVKVYGVYRDVCIYEFEIDVGYTLCCSRDFPVDYVDV